MYSVFATNCKYPCRLEFLRENTDVGRRSIPHRLCSVIQGKTPSALIRSAVANPVPGRKPHPDKANGLLKGREIVRRDYPDHDHPKLLEHVADQPATQQQRPFASRPPVVAPFPG